MKRKVDGTTDYSSADRVRKSEEESQDSQKMIFIEEEGNAVPLGTHHRGSMHTYMSHKLQKLQQLHERSSDEVISQIFHDCVIHVNGATNPSLPDIRRLVTLHGGHFAAYQVSSLTHIICDHFTDAQLKRELQKSKAASRPPQKNVVYVQAKWVVDSIKRDSRLPESEYFPRGSKGRFGTSIKDMFGDSVTRNSKNSSSGNSLSLNSSRRGQPVLLCSSSSSSSHPLSFGSRSQNANDIIDLCSPSPSLNNDQNQSRDLNNEDNTDNNNDLGVALLTSSQQDFVRAVPDELRHEVIIQFQQKANFPFCKTSNNILVGSQGRSSVNEAQSDQDNEQLAVTNDHSSKSDFLERLQEVINYIHGHTNEDDGYALHSYRRERIMHHRIDSWVDQQFQQDPNNSFNSSLINSDIIEGYAFWLLRVDQLEQLKWLLKAIEKQSNQGHIVEQMCAKLQNMVSRQYGRTIYI